MRWRRWVSLLVVLTVGFSLYVFFTTGLEWQTGFQPLERCTSTPASLLSGPGRSTAVFYKLDRVPPGIHCDVRRCKGGSGTYLPSGSPEYCDRTGQSAKFFVHARLTDYLYVPAYGGGFAVFVTVLLMGLVTIGRTARWLLRRVRVRPTG
jgi:hypothetical protein